MGSMKEQQVTSSKTLKISQTFSDNSCTCGESVLERSPATDTNICSCIQGSTEIQDKQETESVLSGPVDLKLNPSSNSLNQIISGTVNMNSLSKKSNFAARRTRDSSSILSRPQPSKLGSYTVLQRVMFNNFFFSVGDIVSLEDGADTYYAQIRILIEDLFCQKYAALLWLLPTTAITDRSDKFNPYQYTYGPQDEWFYSIEELQFVMHAPTEAYKQFISPTPKCTNITHVRLKSKLKRKT